MLWTSIALACLPLRGPSVAPAGRGTGVMHVALCLVMAVHPAVVAVLPAAGHLTRKAR